MSALPSPDGWFYFLCSCQTSVSFPAQPWCGVSEGSRCCWPPWELLQLLHWWQWLLELTTGCTPGPSSATAQPTHHRRTPTIRTRRILGRSPTLASGGFAAWKVQLVVCLFAYLRLCDAFSALWDEFLCVSHVFVTRGSWWGQCAHETYIGVLFSNPATSTHSVYVALLFSILFISTLAFCNLYKAVVAYDW